jgi:hypothetical protein
MKIPRFSIAILGVGAAVLAYFLRKAINDVLVVPLAFLWWRIKLYYQTIPEDDLLTLSAVIIFVIAFASLSASNRSLSDKELKDGHLVQGPVEGLMMFLKGAPGHSSYYRWMVASQLARLAQLFLVQREGRNVQRGDGTLEAPGWDPPEDVKSYLKYGLRRSSTASEVSKLHRTNPLHTVEYLESKIGDRYDAN